MHRKCFGGKEKCENTVDFRTSVCISQFAEASGGDGGSGGNGGSAAGGSAAASSASGEDASAAASASSCAGGGINGNSGYLPLDPPDAANLLDAEVSGSSAIGGSAAGGAGGEGGNGGIGGTASNTANVQIDNMVVICCDGVGPSQNIRVGMNDRKVDITVDKNGNTLVNGKKMDEMELENGTKVFLFRNSEAQNSQA